jgi:hypothetical protein
MFFPALGIFAAAAALVQLGALSIWVLVLKAMLAVTAAIALLLGLALAWGHHKDSRNANHS